MPFRARAIPARLVARRQCHFLSSLKAVPQPVNGSIRHTQTRGISFSSIPEKIFPNITAAWRRSPRSRPEDSMSVFRTAVDSRNTKRVREAYEALRGDLSEEELEGVMSILRNAGPSTALVMMMVLGDMGEVQKVRWTGRVIRDLSKAGKLKEAFKLAGRLEKQDRHPYHHVLHYAVRFDPEMVPDITTAIRTHPKGLMDRDYGVLLRHLRLQFQRGEVTSDDELQARLREILAETEERGIWIGSSGEAELLRLNILRQEWEKVDVLEKKLNAIHIDQRNFAVWDALFDARMVKKDRDAVIQLVRDMSGVKLDPPRGAIVWLVEQTIDNTGENSQGNLADRVLRAMDRVDTETGVDMDSDVWGQCVRRFALGSTASFLGGKAQSSSDTTSTITPEQMDAAVELLARAKARGIHPSIAVVRVLIPLLCESGRVSSALEIHTDFLASKPPPDLSDPRDRSAIGLTFTMLLTSLARSPSRTVLQSAVDLLTSMRNLDLDLHSSNLGSLVILLMRSANDHSTAFNVYAHFHALNPQALGLSARRDILTAFIDMSLPYTSHPPPDLVFEMIKDLRRLEALPASFVFSWVLKLYSNQVTAIRKDRTLPAKPEDPRRGELENLRQNIEDIARRIRLDPEIDPDVPVLTALMDAYNRLGQVDQAFEVWAQLVERRSRSTPAELTQYAPAIAVILDVCAYNDLERRGRKIWAWGLRHGLVKTTKSWEGWLEALCRWGKVDEAVELVCGPMRNGNGDGMEVTIPKARKESLELVLKFSWTQDGEARKAIRDRIQEAWPDLWDEVKWVVAQQKEGRD
ncbi:hypothetical protein BCR39DRAFT_552453 [Naematelia encephala]|uniref:Pentatricopeptide repeat domain-containing protein n=1 Tax=Naematelia encephala TaxID=71784 RepID=A0A1Y2AHA8_9TREE|nr:hypothetical protein BCR39DRAFT_552453 [Naematelia encephala]